MFFFELLFSYVSFAISLYVFLLTYSQSFIPLSANYPRHSGELLTLSIGSEQA